MTTYQELFPAALFGKKNNIRMYPQGKYCVVLQKRRHALILGLLRNKLLLCGYEILDTGVQFGSLHFMILFVPSTSLRRSIVSLNIDVCNLRSQK